MSKHKYTNLICGIGAAVMLLLTVLYLCGGAFFLEAAATELPYVSKLFSTDRVHQINLAAKESDWESMLENALSEEYISCTAVIDGEKFSNVGIRPKGNSSLNTVASSESDRYSFKLEFDHYDGSSTYHGLDKLCLNNAIQDNTYMKDFLCYQMMNFLGADAPLSSFVWITVNGEDWGLYTAVEAIEDAFAQRSYGKDHGQLYKPDSLDMGGGGRGAEAGERKEKVFSETEEPALSKAVDSEAANSEADHFRAMGGLGEKDGFGGPGGMGGSDDVLLRYSDDDPESYPNIFGNAVFDTVTDQDKARLIRSIKALNEGEVESCLNIDAVLRYFAVHNFVLNEDSYTGTMIHNYYLYEENGLLSMVAWDYNLAFGGMGGGDSTTLVNSPIDSPVSSGDLTERPMAAWIFENEQYTAQYHQVMEELISGFFTSGVFSELMENAIAIISSCVEQGPTAFCTYEEFQKGVETLREFCRLRAESVKKQLNSEIPSTSEGQEAESELVDASALSVSDMGSQGGMSGKRQTPGNLETTRQSNTSGNITPQKMEEAPEGAPQGGEMPEGMPPEGQLPENDLPVQENSGEPPEKPGGFGEGEANSGNSTSGGSSSESDDLAEKAGSESSASAQPETDTQEENTPPGDMPNMPFGNNDLRGVQRENAPSEEASSSLETGLLLGASALLLLFGLLFAKFYR